MALKTVVFRGQELELAPARPGGGQWTFFVGTARRDQALAELAREAGCRNPGELVAFFPASRGPDAVRRAVKKLVGWLGINSEAYLSVCEALRRLLKAEAALRAEAHQVAADAATMPPGDRGGGAAPLPRTLTTDRSDVMIKIPASADRPEMSFSQQALDVLFSRGNDRGDGFDPQRVLGCLSREISRGANDSEASVYLDGQGRVVLVGGVDTADEWAVAVEDKDLSAAYASQVPDIRGTLVLPAE